jgi:hypothetical protein
MVANQKTKDNRVPTKADDKEQSKLFIKKACDIEADEKRSAADELLGRLHKKPPEPRNKKPGR